MTIPEIAAFLDAHPAEGWWIDVRYKDTGEGGYARSEDTPMQAARRAVSEAARWSPDFVVKVIPLGESEPVLTLPCTGHVTHVN